MRFAAYLLVLLAFVTLFAGLGRPALTDSDEAFYAEAGREMLAGGDWLTPHFNYRNRFQKPILFYWVVAASYTVAGVGEAAARFGSALAGLGIALITLAAGRRWFDERTGFLAGAIVVTSFGCVSAARLSLPDLPLAFFITLTVWAAFQALFARGGRPDGTPHRRGAPATSPYRGTGRQARRWWLVAALAAALGFLTKGPVALAIPALVLAAPVVFEKAWRRVRPVDLLLAAGLFVLLAAPWYAAMAATHGTGYLRGFFVGDNLERFATTTFNPHRPIYFYVPIVLGGMLPWSTFFALGVRPLSRLVRLRQRPDRVGVRLASWALVPFVLFTASVGKQPRYILPMLAPLGLLLALWIRRAATTPAPLPEAQPRLFRWMAALSGALVMVLAALLWRARPLLFAIPPERVLAGVLLLGAGGGAVIAVAASRRWRHSTLAVAVVAAIVVLVLRYSVFALPDLDPVERMAGRVLAHRQAGESVASYHVFVRNLVFYTHVEQADLYTEENLVAFLGSPDRVICVLPQKDLDRLERAAQGADAGALAATMARVRRLESITYFDAPTAKIGAVLWPNPDRDLQTAVLVTNK